MASEAEATFLRSVIVPFPFIPLLIAGGAAAASALSNGIASGNASRSQAEAADRARELQEKMWQQGQKNYEQSRNDMAPWMDAGQSSLAELMAQMQGGYFDRQFDPSQLANDPGYQFRMAEGQKALERSASARGMLNSGGALKSLARYSQGVASDEYGNAWNRNQAENTGRYNRMANIAGLGQQQSQALGSLGAQNTNAGANFANSMGGLYGAMGNAQAAGHMGMGNAISSGMNTLGSMAMMGMGGGMGIPTQSGGMPAYGQSTMGYETQGYGPWR